MRAVSNDFDVSLCLAQKENCHKFFFLTIFFLTESFIMMTYSTYNICLCVTYSFIMMAPDAPELSRTKLVSDFVSALRASGVGSVDVKQHLMCCYDAYAQQVYVSTSSYAVECLHLLPLARFISLQAPGGPEPALPNTGVATNGHGNRPPGEVSSIVSSLAGKHGPQTLTSARLRPAFCLPVCLRAHALHATRHSPPSIWRWRRCGVDTRAACRWAACAGSGWCANVVPRARKRSLFALCLRPIRLRAPAALMSTSRQ